MGPRKLLVGAPALDELGIEDGLLFRAEKWQAFRVLRGILDIHDAHVGERIGNCWVMDLCPGGSWDGKTREKNVKQGQRVNE